MADAHPPSQMICLSLGPEETWTLHHVLLDRIEREATAADPAQVDPPRIELFHAFETLEAGTTRFTRAELEAIQAVLAEYHHAGLWLEDERGQLEALRNRVSDGLDRDEPIVQVD